MESAGGKHLKNSNKLMLMGSDRDGECKSVVSSNVLHFYFMDEHFCGKIITFLLKKMSVKCISSYLSCGPT